MLSNQIPSIQPYLVKDSKKFCSSSFFHRWSHIPGTAIYLSFPFFISEFHISIRRLKPCWSHVTYSTQVARACRETQVEMSSILEHNCRLLSPAIEYHPTMSAKKDRKVMKMADLIWQRCQPSQVTGPRNKLLLIEA